MFDRKQSGLRNDGVSYDLRTSAGRQLAGLPPRSHPRARTTMDMFDRKQSGLRNDGFSYDLRTSAGRQLAGLPPRHANPWNAFQAANAGHGYSSAQMSSLYHSQQSSAPPSYASLGGGSSGGGSGSGPLSWNAYQRSVGGQGLSRAEISAGYHAQKNAA